MRKMSRRDRVNKTITDMAQNRAGQADRILLPCFGTDDVKFECEDRFIEMEELIVSVENKFLYFVVYALPNHWITKHGGSLIPALRKDLRARMARVRRAGLRDAGRP